MTQPPSWFPKNLEVLFDKPDDPNISIIHVLLPDRLFLLTVGGEEEDDFIYATRRARNPDWDENDLPSTWRETYLYPVNDLQVQLSGLTPLELRIIFDQWYRDPHAAFTQKGNPHD